MSAIVPSIRDIDITTGQRGREITFTFGESFAGHQDVSFRADSMSDGTLHVLGILVAAYQEQPPVLIAFSEEPERWCILGRQPFWRRPVQEAGLRTQALTTTTALTCFSRFETGHAQGCLSAPGGCYDDRVCEPNPSGKLSVAGCSPLVSYTASRAAGRHSPFQRSKPRMPTLTPIVEGDGEVASAFALAPPVPGGVSGLRYPYCQAQERAR